MESPIQIVISAVDNASSTIKDVGNNLGLLEGGTQAAAEGFEALAAAVTAAETAILVAYADSEVASVNLSTSIKDNIEIANEAAKGQGAFADELSYAKTQMNLAVNELNKMTSAGVSAGGATTANKEKLEALNNTLSNSQQRLSIMESEHVKAGTAAQNHELSMTRLEQSISKTRQSIGDLNIKMSDQGGIAKFSADQIDAQQQKVAVLSGKYDELNGRMSLVGASAEKVMAQFEPAIEAGLRLGFSDDKLTDSLNTFENVLGNPTTAIKALSAAQDLAREKGIDLASATNMVVMGMNGMGRGLQTAGIFIKDGIAGMQALDAIQQQVNGHAEAYAKTLRGQLAVGWALVEKAMADAGAVQIPWLEKIKADLILLGNRVLPLFKDEWNAISIQFKTTLLPALEKLWTQLQPLIPYFTEFVSILATGAILVVIRLAEGLVKLTSGFISVASGITDTLIPPIITLVDWLTKAYNWVSNLIEKMNQLTHSNVGGNIASGALNFAKSFAGSIGIPLPFADGGIVTSPTFAMIGEAGPEAVIPLSQIGMTGGAIGSSGNIIINLSGTFMTDNQTARKFGDQIAAVIQQSMKLRTL